MSIKARDLRPNIAEMGFERGTVHTLELALEDLSELRLHMQQLTELQVQCMDLIDKFMTISDGMKQSIDTLRRGKEEVDGA